jgi:prepilin-type N-terminal cleavage/methylation domain-containing protein
MNARRDNSAFSLIEIVLAVAIISVALVGILGLFPAALDSAMESQRETQAALIAKRIFSDLGSRKPFIQRDGESATSIVPVKLGTKGTEVVDFDEGGMLPNSPTEKVAKSSGRPVFRATITITPDTTILSGLPNKLSLVEIAVRTPATEGVKHPRTYTFATLLNADSNAITSTP